MAQRFIAPQNDSWEQATLLRPNDSTSAKEALETEPRRTRHKTYVASTALPLSAWKLDEDRTHLSDEICSASGFLDVVRFAWWLVLGYLATRFLNNGFEQLDYITLIDWIQAVCMGLSLGGIMGAIYIRNWWILGLCVGGAMRLIQRDLDAQRDWKSCGIEHLHGTYIWNQKFVQLSGPLAALWFVVTSEALDRIYNFKKFAFGEASEEAIWKYLQCIFGRPCQYGHFIGAPNIQCLPPDKLLVLGVASTSQEEHRDLDFYGLYDFEDSDAESEHSESSDFENQMRKERKKLDSQDLPTTLPGLCEAASSSEDLEESFVAGETAKELEGMQVMLIYSPDGHHVIDSLSMLKDEGQWHLRLGVPEHRNQYQKIAKADDANVPILLFVPSSRKRPPILLSTDASTMQRGNAIFFCLLWFVPVLLLGICAAVRHVSKFSVWFLVLPDMAEVVLHHKNKTREAHSDTMEQIWHRMSSGWSCVHGRDSIRTEVALFASTFFFVGCQVVLIIACYHLHRTKGSLRALNDLLLFYNQEEPEYHALLLLKLYKIRERISNQRCLRHFASNAFPQYMGSDKSLIWWFQTRAALFADIKFNLEKRNMILLLSMFLSLASGLLAATADFSAQDKFSNMCYAVGHGLISAIILVVYFVLGSLVNVELQSGMEKLRRLCLEEQKPEDMDTVDTAAPSASSPSVLRSLNDRLDAGILSPIRSNPKPEPEDVCLHLLQYSMHRPYELKFLCFTLSTRCVSVAATSLLSIAGGLILWALKRAGFDFVEFIT